MLNIKSFETKCVQCVGVLEGTQGFSQENSRRKLHVSYPREIWMDLV